MEKLLLEAIDYVRDTSKKRLSITLYKKDMTADLVTFTEEILNGKLHFLCSVASISLKKVKLVHPTLAPDLLRKNSIK